MEKVNNFFLRNDSNAPTTTTKMLDADDVDDVSSVDDDVGRGNYDVRVKKDDDDDDDDELIESSEIL